MLFISTLSFALEESRLKAEKAIKEIEILSAADHLSKMPELRRQVLDYIENKKKVCLGEFSSMVLNAEEGAATSAESKNKLTKDEQKLCLKELKELQARFIQNVFLARKNYLDQVHKDRIQELDELKTKALVDLDKNFLSK